MRDYFLIVVVISFPLTVYRKNKGTDFFQTVNGEQLTVNKHI